MGMGEMTEITDYIYNSLIVISANVKQMQMSTLL